MLSGRVLGVQGPSEQMVYYSHDTKRTTGRYILERF